MSEEKKVEPIEDRLTAFIHESYGLALAALGLSQDQIKETATTVDDSLTNNFDWQGPLQTFRFATESGSDEEYVEATSLEEAAISIASRNGWYYEPEREDDEGFFGEVAREQRDIQAQEDNGIAEYERREKCA